MKLRALVKAIRNEYKLWDAIAEHGCSDPFWEDGCNMNLVRNHIIYFKNQLISQAAEENARIPQEIYWTIPPLVPKTYMVKSGKHYLRHKKWDKERISKIVLRADTDMALF